MTRGILEVLLIAGCDLKKAHFFGKRNPYVIIKYDYHSRTSKIAQGKGPHSRRKRVWDETFTFDVDYPDAELKKDHELKISFTVMERSHSCCFIKDTFIGEATVYIKDVLSLGAEVGKAAIRPTEYRVVLRNKVYHGEIRVAVSFRKVEDEKDQDVEDGKKVQSLINE
ncbi:hypothetical protein C5167_002984 [Papaver somniferum]|uniref:C2 domain-containing protein n=1 Tax=Papaver somniferum TaxID=3469 RepID=A0A4Y7L0T2_PAPSO|nr:elicitor-responsive protein 1-like [Papaver somniferum]RZC78776.1 hypothetical protein C5167_002984 [Papaver somniferum]